MGGRVVSYPGRWQLGGQLVGDRLGLEEGSNYILVAEATDDALWSVSWPETN